MQTLPRFLLAGAALVIAVAAAGCNIAPPVIGGPCIHTDSNGDPCGTQFYYPTGITVDPGDPNLVYVSNGNADLRYAGGTLASVDTALFECAMAYFCRGGRPNRDACIPGDIAGLVKDAPECNVPAYLDVLKGLGTSLGTFVDPTPTFDGNGKLTRAACHNNPTDPLVIECDEPWFIKSAVQVGNFAGSIRVQTGTDLGGHKGANRRLWLPVRGDPSITFAYATVGTDLSMPPSVSLACGDKESVNTSVLQPADFSSSQADQLVSCTGQRITVRDFHSQAFPGFACSNDNPSACVSLPPEPFGIYYDEGCPAASLQPNGSCTAAEPYQHLLVSYLETGEVALIDASQPFPVSTEDTQTEINDNGPSIVLDLRGGFFPADSAGRRGTFAIVPQQPGNEHSWWYATSRLNPILATFRIADANVILGGQQVVLNTGAYATGADVRDIVFDPSECEPGQRGCRAFAVNEQPPSVFTIDTRLDTTVGVTPGALRNDVIDIVDVCQGPARLAFQHFTSPYEYSRLYVVCFASGQVLVIDPDLSAVVAQTIVGRGSNEIAFNFGRDDVRQHDLPASFTLGGVAHKRAYVTDFLDMNVSVIDLDPGSPTENQVIGRIGLTDPQRLQ